MILGMMLFGGLASLALFGVFGGATKAVTSHPPAENRNLCVRCSADTKQVPPPIEVCQNCGAIHARLCEQRDALQEQILLLELDIGERDATIERLRNELADYRFFRG